MHAPRVRRTPSAGATGPLQERRPRFKHEIPSALLFELPGRHGPPAPSQEDGEEEEDEEEYGEALLEPDDTPRGTSTGGTAWGAVVLSAAEEVLATPGLQVRPSAALCGVVRAARLCCEAPVGGGP